MSKTIRSPKPKVRKGDNAQVRISKVHEERIKQAKEPKVEDGLTEWQRGRDEREEAAYRESEARRLAEWYDEFDRKQNRD
jgi:hypothetical protein